MFASGVTSFISSLVNAGSSVFSRFVCAQSGYALVQTILNFIFGLLYNVAKYLLYMVDLIFSYIQKLAGLDMAMDSLEGMLSPDSDIVFNFLVSGSDLVTAILRNLIVLAIVVIIIFAIVGIIKGQYDAMKKNSAASPFDTLKSMFKAFILLLVTPFMTLGGIIVSDLLLQTLYKATNVSGAMSLGTQVFVTSASSANAYRVYAQKGKRIPITFDGTKSSEINAYFSENSVSEGFIKYLQDSKNSGNEVNPIYATYMTFMAADFTPYLSMNDVLSENESVINTKQLYDKYYDYYIPSDDDVLLYPELMKLSSYAEQYYAMADVIDFCVRSGSEVYMRTIEQVLKSVCNLSDDVADKEKIFQTIIRHYEIKFHNGYDAESGQPVDEISIKTTNDYLMQIDKNRNALISFNSTYFATSDSGEPDVKMQIRSIHLVGETDELRGAKFIVATKNQASANNGVTQEYYQPLVNGYAGGFQTEFQSDYIMDGNIIVAKGIFKEATYPTAIKIARGSVNDTNIIFYREDIESQAVGELGDYFSLKVDAPKGGFFGRLIKMIKALFDPSELIPEINVNFDALALTYDKSSGPSEVDTLLSGKIRLGYFMKFSPTYPTVDGVSNFCLAFNDLYAAPKMNYLLLVIGSFLLVRVCLSAISSLIERSYELFLIFLTYPAACATIPIDDGGAYKTWLKGYFERIFRAYGFILGINFVLMLFPIIEKIQFFSQDDIGTSKIVRRVGTLFFSVMSVRQITEMLNLFVAIMCQLVAFTLIETIPETISTIIGGKDAALKVKDNNVFTKLKDKAVKATTAVAKVAVPPLKGLEYVFGGKVNRKRLRQDLRNKILNSTGLDAFSEMGKFIPGSQLVAEAKYKLNLKKQTDEQKAVQKTLFDTLNDPLANKTAVQDAMAEYQSASVAATQASGKKSYVCKLNSAHKYTDGMIRSENGRIRRYIISHGGTKEFNNFHDLSYGGGWLCPKCFEDYRGQNPESYKLEDMSKKKSDSGDA